MSIEYEGAAPLRYVDGTVPQVGDKIRVNDVFEAVVVGVTETNEYFDESYRSFGFVNGSILITDPIASVIAINDDDVEIRLLDRPHA